MTIAEIIGTIIGGFGVIGGLAAWVLRTTISPVRLAIDNNSKVIERVIKQLDEHADKLIDHGERIVKIETTHEMRHGIEASA